MENQDLDQILNGDVEPEAPPELEAAAPEPTVEATPRDEKGRFAPKGEQEETPAAEAAPPAASDDSGPLVPRKALQDERNKRQTLEEQLQQMQRQLEQVQNPPAPAPSIFEDEQAWQQQFGQDVISQAVSAASFNARLEMSEMMARQSHNDFEDKKAVFLEAMKTTPGLQQRALQDPHPWNFAYQYVVNQERMQELAAVNVTDLEQKLRAQIEAEYQAKAQGALKNLPAGVPPSLSQERNVGSRQGPAWAGPAPLGDILNRV